jgi:hypothetical protein
MAVRRGVGAGLILACLAGFVFAADKPEDAAQAAGESWLSVVDAAQVDAPGPAAAVIPFADARFTPIDPARPDGPQIVVLRGDPGTGPSAMLMRMKSSREYSTTIRPTTNSL